MSTMVLEEEPRVVGTRVVSAQPGGESDWVVRITWSDGRVQQHFRTDVWTASKAAYDIDREWGLL